MKSRIGMLGFAIALVLAAGPALAEDKALTVDTSVGFYSDYMFRGFNLYDGMAIQPAVVANYDTGHGTIGGSLWMHLSGEENRQEEKFTELDETLWYATSFASLSLKVGAVWYTYPDSDDEIENSGEVFAVVGYDDSSWNPVALSPTFSVYHDWDEYDAQYYELGLSHPLTIKALGDGFSMTPYVAFGFSGNGEKVYEEDGLVQVTFGASSTLALGNVSVIPSLNYTRGIADGLDNEFWMGTSLGYSF